MVLFPVIVMQSEKNPLEGVGPPSYEGDSPPLEGKLPPHERVFRTLDLVYNYKLLIFLISKKLLIIAPKKKKSNSNYSAIKQTNLPD